MALIEIKKNPTSRDLFWFGLLLPVFAAVFGRGDLATDLVIGGGRGDLGGAGGGDGGHLRTQAAGRGGQSTWGSFTRHSRLGGWSGTC